MRLWSRLFVLILLLVVMSDLAPVAAKTRLYLANPLGFSEAGRYFKDNQLKPGLERLGFEVVDPWVLTDQNEINKVLSLPSGPERQNAWRVLNTRIGLRNQSEIDHADILVAVLDGVDIDSGTAAEIGYAFAKNKMIMGYRGDFRLSADNEGATVNLQVEFFIEKSGGRIVSTLPALYEALQPAVK